MNTLTPNTRTFLTQTSESRRESRWSHTDTNTNNSPDTYFAKRNEGMREHACVSRSRFRLGKGLRNPLERAPKARVEARARQIIADTEFGPDALENSKKNIVQYFRKIRKKLELILKCY